MGNTKAPSFKLQDQEGKERKLSDYHGKWVVLYFYPKDSTPGCTTEACNFRDDLGELQNLDAVVIGISKDSITSHEKFANKNKLNFPILSDESSSVIKAYGAQGVKKMFGKEYLGTLRKTFIIDPKGNIVKEFAKVSPSGHSKEVYNAIKELM